MPFDPAPLFLVIRPPGYAPVRGISLETLTAHLRSYRKQRMATREELKALRLKAMGVVGEQTQANADMYNRVIAAGQKVAAARDTAETAQMGVINEQIADLGEMAEEMEEFGQTAANPPKTAAGGVTSPSATAAPAKTTATLSAGSEALKVLQAAEPPALGKDAWAKGDAYEGTHPEAPKT